MSCRGQGRAGSRIIRLVRRWLLLLIVLTLPLRGWMGDAMAAQALQHAAGPQAHVHAVEHAAPAAAAHDCAGHGHSASAQVQAAQPAPDSASADANADCPTCAHCQACSSVALTPASSCPAATVFSQPPPQTAQAAYASAEPAHFFKPPRL
jgi:hypothetical protein